MELRGDFLIITVQFRPTLPEGLGFPGPEIWPAGDGIGAATCLRAGAPVRASSAQMRLYRIGHRSHVFYRLAQFFC